MRGWFETIGSIFRPETIEELPVRHIDPFRRDLLSWLFGREALQQDEPPQRPKGPPFLAWLLGPEELPEGGSERGGGRTPFLKNLFAGEELPQDEQPEKAGGRGAAPPARDTRAG